MSIFELVRAEKTGRLIKKKASPLDIDVIYDDHSLVVINKPPGLLSEPGLANHRSAKSLAIEKFGEIHTVHRLDCHTSGVMVFAKNKVILRQLHKQFRERAVEKIYEALAYGNCSTDSGAIELPISADFYNRPKQRINFLNGAKSTTYWQRLESYNDYTRFRLFPITGRTHQLRIHLQAIGHPILGDKLYAKTIRPIDEVLYPNMCLHATRLTITHPETGRLMAFQSKVPF